MSASREKKARKDVQDVVTSKQQTEQQAHKAKTRKNVLIGVAITLVVVLLIGSIVLFKGPHFRRNSVAVTTGEHELSPVMVRYFYQDAFAEIAQNYGSYLGMMYDTTGNFDEVVYNEETGETWGDVVMEQTMTKISSTYAVYDEAKANGHELSEDAQAEIDNLPSAVEMYASISNMSPDGYINAVYGSGCDLDSYVAYEELLIYVSDYESTIYDSYTYTDDEIDAAYEEAPEDYNRYTYHAYLVSADADEDSDGMATAKKTAKSMAKEAKGDLDRYLELCNEQSESETYTDGTASLHADYSASYMTDTVKEWVTDPDRKEGDTAAVEYGESGYYVLYYVSTNTNDYDALNIRSIQISANATDADGNTTVDWDTAQAKLDEMTTAFEEYDDMLTGFDELAVTYSADSNTKNNGGAYEVVGKGQFETAVDSWLFDEERKEGDNAVIQGENCYYFLYVEGSAGNYRDHLVDLALRNADYADWFNAATENASCEEDDFGMDYVERTLTVSSAS